MKKDNNNRRKLAMGAVLAAGVTTGAMSACTGTEAGTTMTSANGDNVEMTAADKVVVDGQEVEFDSSATRRDTDQRAMPMYGPRRGQIRLMYGPRPRPRMEIQPGDDAQQQDVETQVINIVASALGINPSQVSASSRIAADLNASAAQRQLIKQMLEERFEITISKETYGVMLTVGDLVDCVNILKGNDK